jgi:fido (protein-threonine AMPylation protein)
LTTNCPTWVQESDSVLHGIALAIQAFGNFASRQNPKKHVLCYGDIKQWHERLFQSAVPLWYYAGNVRQDDHAKPCLKVDVHVNGVTGTHWTDVEDQMKRFSAELERATNATDEYLATARPMEQRVKVAAQIAAFAGGTIIRIHPFLNGNGRMARLVMNFFIHRYLGIMPFYIDRPKHPDYSSASAAVMGSGSFIPLMQYLVEIIAQGI